MARDIFNRRTDVFGGTFSADEAWVTFPNVQGIKQAYAGDVGLLVQDLQTTYMQQVTRLYEVGRPAIYYVGGRTNGDASVNRVVGPRTITIEFYRKFGDVCQARTNLLQFSIQTGCPSGEGGGTEAGGNIQQGNLGAFVGLAEYKAHFCVITSIGIGVRAADMLINENLRFMFSSFEYNTDQKVVGPQAGVAVANFQDRVF